MKKGISIVFLMIILIQFSLLANGPGSGEITVYPGDAISELTVRYKISQLLGEPTINGNYKWESDSVDSLPYDIVVWLKVTNNLGSAYIRLNPTVPKKGQWGHNATGSPNWNKVLILEFDGKKAISYFEAETAKDFWREGFSVVNAEFSQPVIKPDNQSLSESTENTSQDASEGQAHGTVSSDNSTTTNDSTDNSQLSENQISSGQPRIQPERSYSPPPAPQIDYSKVFRDFVAKDIQRRDEITKAVDSFFDKISEMQQASQRQRRWNAAASLETSGQSPEALIRQVEQKQKELEQLAREKQAQHKRDMDKFEAEAEKAAIEAQSGEAAVLGGIFSVVGRIAGTLSIDAQRKKTQRELEEQLKKAFTKIKEQIITDIKRNIAVSGQGMAQTLFPEEFEYFEKIISYYNQYQQRVVNGFTISHTDWMYPQNRLPVPPRLADRPDFSTTSIKTLMESKYEFIKEGGPNADEAKESLDFLSAFGIDEFPSIPEPYYYRSLITSDVLERYLLSKRAAELNNRSPFKQQAQNYFGDLNGAFFDDLKRNQHSLPKRVWDVGLLPKMSSANGDGAYLFALRNNVGSLDYLLGLGNSNTRKELVQSLLSLASTEGIISSIQILIDRGAKINDHDSVTGMTPIIAAALNGQTDFVSTLDIDFKVDPVRALRDAHQSDFTSASYYLSKYLMDKAFRNNDKGLLGTSLEYVPNVIHEEYQSRSSYLGYTVARNKRQFLDVIFKSGISPNARDLDGNPLLAVAMNNNADEDTVILLINRGADLDVYNKSGLPVLHWAVSLNRIELVSYLLDRNAPVNQKDTNGSTSLMTAIQLKEDEIIYKLMEYSPDYRAVDYKGRIALHSAAVFLDGEILNALIKETGDIDLPDFAGDTPLHLALSLGSAEAARELLSRELSINRQNKKGESYLHLAAANIPNIIPQLLQKAAKVNLTDVKGDTPLHTAILSKQTPAIFHLIRNGASLRIQNKEGDAPVHRAIKNQNSAWMSLIDSLRTIELQDKEGNTAIHLLLKKQWGASVSLIYKYKPDPDTANGKGQTYLHLAAQNNDRIAAELLINSGADLNAVDDLGNTALHYAGRQNALEVVAVLLKAGADKDMKNNEGDTAKNIAKEAEYKETEDFIRLFARK